MAIFLTVVILHKRHVCTHFVLWGKLFLSVQLFNVKAIFVEEEQSYYLTLSQPLPTHQLWKLAIINTAAMQIGQPLSIQQPCRLTNHHQHNSYANLPTIINTDAMQISQPLSTQQLCKLVSASTSTISWSFTCLQEIQSAYFKPCQKVL